MRLLRSGGGDTGVVIFSKSTCCMCHTVKVLFEGIGVHPIVHEIDQISNEGKNIEKALMALAAGSGSTAAVPAVFIGGAYVGSTNEVMSMHLGGSLLPLLL
ncbi:hypothetical protein Syun_007823 [Stephania yunnanensis]|uniref:Glutaredoxin domain-containing protein n=1 Tax=Stephania yunnanensis TaxID=152371 RepID=A0AAP0PYV5_9MAGN